MRGKVFKALASFRASRITPACAGKRCPWLSMPGGCRDHPRVCGEKPFLQLRTLSAQGSPPRVRGKENGLCQSVHRLWITPACAGKRSPLRPTLARSWITPACAGKSISVSCIHFHTKDHPRVCGEKLSAFSTSRTLMGSPPRVRGKDSKGW